MRILDIISLALTIIGGLNWLLIGVFHINLVALLSGGKDKPLARIIYIIVGLCALYSITLFKLL